MPLNMPSNVADAPKDDTSARPTLVMPGNVASTETPAATLRDKAVATGQGMVGGFADMLPLAGAISGTMAGGPPGGIIGTGLGFIARNALKEFGDIPDVEEMPEELRPFGYFGNVVGGSVSAGGPLVQAVKTGARSGVRFFDRILETAQRRPVAFGASETSAAVMSGVAEGTAESAAPGETGVRIGAGIAGGAFSPGGGLLLATDAAKSAITRISGSLTQSGREASAVREINRILGQTDEVPADIARAIRDARIDLPAGASPTADALTNSPGLKAMAAEFRRRDPQFADASLTSNTEALNVYKQTIKAIATSGDPGAVQAIAELRQRYFDTLLQGQFDAAEAAAVTAAGRIGVTSPERLSVLSSRATEIVQQSLTNARTAERALYDAVEDGPASADSIVNAFYDIRANDLPTGAGNPIREPPALAVRFVNEIVEAGRDNTTPTGIVDASGRSITRTTPGSATPSSIAELRKFRTEMLDAAREASANGAGRDARVFGRLAEAALDDLALVAGGEDSALGVARAFSVSLNDTFTRTFANQASQTTRSGAARLPPELLVRRATATGQEVGELRLRELQEAVEFGNPDAARELLAIQEQFLRSTAQKMIGHTGQITPHALTTFKRNHGPTLDMFHGLRDQLADVATAQEFFGRIAQRTTDARRTINKRAAFAQIAQMENPTLEVGRILSGSRPADGFRQLAVLARRGGDDAVDGLKSAVLDNSFQRANTNVNGFSFAKMQQDLFEPRRAGQDSTIDLMKRTGVMSQGEVTRMKAFFKRTDAIEEAMRTGRGLDDLLTGESAAFDLVLRVAGAKTGTALSGGNNSIIAAAAGSRFARTIFDRIPAGRIQDVLVEAFKNPAFMETLLKRAPDPRTRIELGKKLNAFVFSVIGNEIGSEPDPN